MTVGDRPLGTIRRSEIQAWVKHRSTVLAPGSVELVYRWVSTIFKAASAVAAHLARYRPGTAGLVFTNTLGKPPRRNTAGDMWHRAATQADLPKWPTFHDLRHFYASLLIARGCSVKAVQRRLGHQSAMETLDTYGRLLARQR